MAKIVNKELKRKEIALASKELFLQKGFKGLTVLEVANRANIGKGTIYEYFKNKEDIIFEIMMILQVQHNVLKKEKLLLATTTKQRVKIFFDFFYSESEVELREIYKEYLAISLSTSSVTMAEFQSICFKNYFSWFKAILQQGVDEGEILSSSLDLAKGIFVMGDGFLVSNCSTIDIIDIQKDMDSYIDAIFELIEVKK